MSSKSLSATLSAVLAALASAGDPVPLECQQYVSPYSGYPGSMVGLTVDADGTLTVAGSERERATVYRRDPTGWTYTAEIPPPVQFGWDFARGVRLQGTTLCCSEALNPEVVVDGGAVHVFEEVAGAWTLQGTLRPSDPVAGEKFSFFLGSFDVWGDWVAVGSPSKGGGAGALYVFRRFGTTWLETAKILAPQASGGFGKRVALDDRVMVVQHDAGTEVYARQGGQWIWAQTLKTPLGGDVLGPLKLSGDRIVAGRGFVGSQDPNNGWVDVYRLAGTAWVPESELLAMVQPHVTYTLTDADIRGSRLAAMIDTGLGNVVVYEQGPGGWAPVVNYQPQLFGCYWGSGGLVLLDDEVAVGYPYSWPPDGVFLGDHGSVEFGALQPAPASYCTGKTNSDGCVARIDSCGVPTLAGDLAGTVFDVTADASVGQKAGMLFYGYAPAASPFLGGTLCIQPPLRRTPVQFAGGDATPCSGTYTFDFLARIQSGTDPFLAEGAGAFCQWWYRDPGDPTGTGLSDGLALTIWP